MCDNEIDLHDSDQDVSEHHSKLVGAVEQLDKGRRVKKAERSEPSIQVSEYHLVKSGVTDKDSVRIQDLVKSLGRRKDQNNISKKLRYIQKKSRVLPKPLEKPAAERIKRAVGYDNVKKDLTKWNGIIARNRIADQLSFPLKRTAEVKNFNASKTPDFLKGFKTKSDLMKKFEEVDPSLLYPPAEEEEKDNKCKMAKKEMILKRKKIARLRAQQSYQEAKTHRQRKIKSKKFHRIQKKDKIKQQLKEFEILQNTNPEEALAKLEQLDKTRAEERISLRHKNTGQWAKNQQIRAKYNKETRQILANHLAISRELTQKLKRIDTDDEDEDEEQKDEEDILLKNDNEDNMKTESEFDDFVMNYQRYRDKKQQKKEEKKEEKNIENSNEVISKKKEVILGSNKVVAKNSKTTNVKKNNDTLQENSNDKNKRESENPCYIAGATSEWHVEECNESNNEMEIKLCNKKYKSQNIDEMFDVMEEKLKHKVDLKLQKLKNKLNTKSNVKKHEEEEKENEDDLSNLEFENFKQKPIFDYPLEETTSRENVQVDKDLTSLKTLAKTEQEPTSNSHEMEIHTKKYLNKEPKYLKTQMPDIVTGEEENSEQEEEMHEIMSEAFSDDTFDEEFRKEQEEEMKKSQPQNIDLSLPGWGSWTGPNIKKSKVRRKKKRFILNMPKEMPRRPENQGKVIIFEDDDKKLKKHQVKELPYPFTKVKDYEATLRAPISRTFVPMNAHLQITQPAVITKLGQIIEPMDDDILMKKPILKKTLKRRMDKKNNRKNIAKNVTKRRKPNVTAQD
ncbi:U3 small nucleolar RNA-associated protein 14 homolog C [Cataglyphis hispanica]|uniref:U3 small nucleolar RNA-associated protein 14 homolog C n=1 Tax=Cataglyphis hispanica TaxID=1086592 RepID=UPI00217F73DF|nr:U3 small nucleolar RNA-associated protein 14 homolog C [Cataglyphis hispanica]